MTPAMRANWIRLPNDLGGSNKALELEHYLPSMALYVLIVGYCDRQRTDGFVPSRAFGRAIAPGEECKHLIADLLQAGFLEKAKAGYSVVDYLAFQRSADEINAASEKASKAIAARWSAPSSTPSNAPSNAPTNTDRLDRPDRPEETEETDQTDRYDPQLALRLVDRVQRAQGREVAERLSALIVTTCKESGHDFAADAVDRFLDKPASEIRNPITFFRGVLKHMEER